MAEKILSIGTIIDLVAYGVPALMIVFGLFSYLSVYFINGLAQNTGMVNAGSIMVILGVVFYLIELVVSIVATYYTANNGIYYK